MTLHLSFSLYWLLLPVAALLVGFIAYKTRDLGSGPGDALVTFFWCVFGAGVFALFLLGLMALHLFSK